MDYLGTFETAVTGHPEVPDPVLWAEGRIVEDGLLRGHSRLRVSSGGEGELLRDFRDRILMKSSLGRAFVDSYYTHGPALAHTVAQSEWLKAMVRVMLLPLVGVAKLLLLLV